MKKKISTRRVWTVLALCSLILSSTAFGWGGMGRVAAKQNSVAAAKAFQADASGTRLRYAIKKKNKPNPWRVRTRPLANTVGFRSGTQKDLSSRLFWTSIKNTFNFAASAPMGFSGIRST